MLPAVRLLTMLGAASLVVCVTHASPLAAQASNAIPVSRFGDLRELVLAEAREPAPLPVKMGPRYPENAKRQGVEAIVPMAFIVDTLGGIEPQSITFLDTPDAPAEFRESVCDFLVSRARYAPLMRDGQRRRAFVVQPFGFATQPGPLPGMVPMATEQREAVRRLSWDSVATLLAKQPHCR